jgi:hypothetical protein
LSCYNGGDCFIGKIQSCEKVELIGNHRRVTMVETACENNDEHIDSDSDTIEVIVEKDMVVAVLADFFIVGVAQNCKTLRAMFVPINVTDVKQNEQRFLKFFLCFVFVYCVVCIK